MPPHKGHKLQLTEGIIQTAGKALVQIHRLLSPVFHPDRPGDHILLLKHSVIKADHYGGSRLPHGDHQGLALFLFIVVQSGHSRNPVGTGQNLIALKPKVRRRASVRMTKPDTVLPVISHAAGGQLLGKTVQRIASISLCLGRISGKPHVSPDNQLRQIFPVNPPAIVGVQQNVLLVRIHLIAAVLCLQRK